MPNICKRTRRSPTSARATRSNSDAPPQRQEGQPPRQQQGAGRQKSVRRILVAIGNSKGGVNGRTGAEVRGRSILQVLNYQHINDLKSVTLGFDSLRPLQLRRRLGVRYGFSWTTWRPGTGWSVPSGDPPLCMTACLDTNVFLHILGRRQPYHSASSFSVRSSGSA